MPSPDPVQLTPDAVNALMRACLFRDGESMGEAVIVDGIARRYGFHPGRIAEHRGQIAALLGELPDEFHADRGGGWSFLQACNDRHGRQWCDLHQTMEALFCLGIAADRAKWMLRRDMWATLPGGMPYVRVLG